MGRHVGRITRKSLPYSSISFLLLLAGYEDTASSGGIVCHIRNRAAHHRQKPHCPAQRWREFSMFPPTYSDFDYAGVGTDVNCERVKL